MSQIVSLTYDGVQRLNKVAFSRGQLIFAYHPATSQLTAINAPDSVNLTYGYDRERLTSTTWSGPVAGAVKYSYDANGRITGIALNNSAAVAFQYDISDFLTKAGDLTIQRLRQSRQLQSTTLGTVNDSWSYDSFGKVTGYQAKNGATVLYSVQYSYDKLNRIASKIETIQGSTITWNYGYDAVGQLTEVKRNGTVTERYSYDANGNRMTALNGITASYDSQDRLLQYSTATYSYTLNGERFGRIDGGQTTLYRYDELSNLTAITLPNGSLIEYLIDGQNRRIGKKVNGTLVQGWLYEDQLRPVAELDGTGAVVSRFVYGDRINVPEYMVKGGVTYRFVLDHLGSVRLVVNSQTGEVVQRMDYDAWGVVTQDTNPGFQPFGFAGGLWDGQTGLVRFGARDYDAKVGRWTSKDTIRFDGGDTNLYSYSGRDPINKSDPKGLYLLYVHFMATYIAEILHGRSDTTAKIVASLAAGIDFIPGSQGTDAEHANWHAMAGKLNIGCDNERYQTPDEVREGVRQIIAKGNSSNLFDRALAYHAAQDSWAGGHQYQQWEPGFLGLPSWEHFKQDAWPDDFIHLIWISYQAGSGIADIP